MSAGDPYHLNQFAYAGIPNQIQPSRCECHECTQIRWKMSFQGQLQGSQSGVIPSGGLGQHNPNLQTLKEAQKNG